MFSKTLAYLHLPIKIVNYCETAIYCLMIVICVKVFDSSWEQLASLCLNTALVRWEQIVWHRLQNILTYAKLFSCVTKHWSTGNKWCANIAIYFKTYKMFPYFAKQWFAWNTSSAKHCYITKLAKCFLTLQNIDQLGTSRVQCAVKTAGNQRHSPALRPRPFQVLVVQT